MDKASLQVKPVTTLPLVDFGPVKVDWVFKDGNIIYHLYRGDALRRWPGELAMRQAIGDVFEALGVSSDTVVGSYTEEVDSWAVKAPGVGGDTERLVAMTATFGELLAEKMRDAA
jgi:hypothetical protein